MRGTHYDMAKTGIDELEGDVHACAGDHGDPRPAILALMQVEATLTLAHAVLAVADAIRAK